MSHVGAIRMIVIVAAFSIAGAAAAASAAPADAGTPGARAAEAPLTRQAPPSGRADAYVAYLQGRRLETREDYDGAERAYREAMRLDPRSADPPAALAMLLLQREKATEATAVATAALALDDSHPDAHWVLGTLAAATVLDTPGPIDDRMRDAASTAIGHLDRARATRRFDLNLLLTLGRLHLAVGDYTAAIERLIVVREDLPGAPQVLSLLARAYEGAGRRAEAIDALEGVQARGPRGQAVLIELAALYERERRWLDAANAYARALGENYRSIELRSRQATALARAGAADEARHVMGEVVKANPTNVVALYTLGDIERRAGQLEAAEATARRLMSLNGSDLRGPYLLAVVLSEQHRHQQVIDALAPIAAARSPTADPSTQVAALLLQLGQAYETLGRLDEAVATFAQARAAAPDDLSADFAIVEAYRQAGRVDDAFEALRAARARFPDDSRLLRLEAQVLQQAGRVDEAAALLKQGGAADGRVTMVVALAQIYADAGRYDDAVAVLGDAERRSPGDVLLKFQRGAVLERRRDFEGAERAFRDALALDPSHAPTLNYLGYMLADRGEKLDEAVSLLGRAVAIDPENGSYLDSLGWAHFRRAEYAEAREYLARAASLLGRNSVVQDHYGDVLFKLDDREGAAAAWQRALDGDLQDVERAELERKLRQAREP